MLHQAPDKILILNQVSAVFNNLCSLMHIYLQSTSAVLRETYIKRVITSIHMAGSGDKNDSNNLQARCHAYRLGLTWWFSEEGGWIVDVVVVSCLVKVSVPTTSVS